MESYHQRRIDGDCLAKVLGWYRMLQGGQIHAVSSDVTAIVESIDNLSSRPLHDQGYEQE